MRVAALLVGLVLLDASAAHAADAFLVFGRSTDLDERPTGDSSEPVAKPPSVGLSFGPESAGLTPVTAATTSLVVPLIRAENAPWWLRKGPATLRLVTPAVGHLGGVDGKTEFRLEGRVAVEDAEGRVLGEYRVEVSSALPEGYAPGDEVGLSIVATPSDQSVASPAYAAVVYGRLEEVQ